MARAVVFITPLTVNVLVLPFEGCVNNDFEYEVDDADTEWFRFAREMINVLRTRLILRLHDGIG